jgi:hypothetical protein
MLHGHSTAGHWRGVALGAPHRFSSDQVSQGKVLLRRGYGWQCCAARGYGIAVRGGVLLRRSAVRPSQARARLGAALCRQSAVMQSDGWAGLRSACLGKARHRRGWVSQDPVRQGAGNAVYCRGAVPLSIVRQGRNVGLLSSMTKQKIHPQTGPARARCPINIERRSTGDQRNLSRAHLPR